MSGRRGRVLLPTLYATQGGSTRVLLATADALREEFDALVRGPIAQAGERTQAIFPDRPLAGPWRKLAVLPALARLLVAESLALRRIRPDTIHVHDEPSLYVYGLAARALRPRPRLVWHIHVDPGRALAARLRRTLADFAVMISTHTEVVLHLPHLLIRNPIGPHRPKGIAGTRPEDRLAALGVVGALYPQKGQDRAIAALAALKRLPGGEGARLTLVGPVLDADYAQGLRRQADELGLSDAVVFAGPRSPESAFDGIGLALFPSLSENQPLALAEALAGGLPAVASDIPAHRAMLAETGASAAALTTCEPQDFAAAIQRAARTVPLPVVAATVEALFAPERFAESVRALHRDLIRAARR